MTANPSSVSSSVRSWEPEVVGGLRLAIILSIVASVSWVCLTLLFVAFWADGFTLVQSVVVVVVSLLVLGATLVGAWLSFGLRLRDRWFD